MPYGTHKLLGAASTAAAWKDWRMIQAWCEQNGHSELAARHAPKEGAGHKTVDKRIEKLRVALGAPAGPWSDNVLEGLAPTRQQQLPPGVGSIVEEALATGDLAKANERLHQLSGGKTVQQVTDEWAGQMQTPADPEQRVESAAKRPSKAELRAFVVASMACSVTIQEIYQKAHEAWPEVDWGKTQNWRAVQRCVWDLTRQGKLQSHVNDQGQEAYQAAPAQREQRQGDEPTYSMRVYRAYAELAAETQSPDVAINALHRRVGGSIHELHAFLRQECQAQRCAVSTGEPAFAGDAARQSALTLPGEIDRATGKPQSFLLIKLIEPPPMTQEHPLQQTAAQPEPGRRLNRDDLDVIIEALEYRCDAISGGTDIDEVARLKSIGATLEKLRALEAQPQRPEHERYERLLRATAALRYPAEERTPELEARIEKTIARKVGEFTQERQAKAYEAGLRKELAARHPNLTPEQEERYERKINELVAEFQKNQAQRQQQAQRLPDAARDPQHGRGRGMER
jgi:hypothetical protein